MSAAVQFGIDWSTPTPATTGRHDVMVCGVEPWSGLVIVQTACGRVNYTFTALLAALADRIA